MLDLTLVIIELGTFAISVRLLCKDLKSQTQAHANVHITYIWMRILEIKMYNCQI